MKKKKFRIDWQNHLVAFVATIIGIFIGLSLDQKQQDNETKRRLHDFQKLIDEEITVNTSRLDSFLVNSHKHERQLRFLVDRKIENNIIRCSSNELDSVKAVWFSNPFIINTEKLNDNSFKIYFALSMFDFASQNTVWESFRNTDLINNLEVNEITTLTRQYNDFERIEKVINGNNDKLRYLIDNRQIDKTISALSQPDYLNKIASLLARSNLAVDQAIVNLAAETGYPFSTKYPSLNMDEIVKSKETIK